MKVCKFGGVAMATAHSVKLVDEILSSDSDRRIAVLSAMGKRFKGDSKVTDILYACSTEFKKQKSLLREVFDRYNQLYSSLNVEFDYNSLYQEYAKQLDKLEKEELLSLGERLSAMLFAKYIGWRYMDAGEVIRFNGINIDYQKSYIKAKEKLSKGDRVVLGGFYGRDKDGRIRLLSRGGSDVSGAIIARGVNATLYENWTDVNGYYKADPNIVSNPEHIDNLSYGELRRASLVGASTLHYDSVIPLSNRIPILIKSVFERDKRGTLINNKEGLLRCIAYKKDLLALTLNSNVKCIPFLDNLIGELSKNGVVIERVSTLSEEVILYLSNVHISLEVLMQRYDIGFSKKSLSLISVIGYTKDILTSRLFSVLNKVKIYEISLYGEEILLAVDNYDLEDIVKTIYKEL